jgi:hypothetical protein
MLPEKSITINTIMIFFRLILIILIIKGIKLMIKMIYRGFLYLAEGSSNNP